MHNLYPSFFSDASITQYYILTGLNLSKLGTRTKHFQVTGCFYGDFLQINDHSVLKKKDNYLYSFTYYYGIIISLYGFIYWLELRCGSRASSSKQLLFIQPLPCSFDDPASYSKYQLSKPRRRLSIRCFVFKNFISK